MLGRQALRAEVEAHFEVVPSRCSGDELVFICPCGCGDRSGNRSVHLKTGLTACWRCGKKNAGDFVRFCRNLGIQVSADSRAIEVTEADQLVNSLQSQTLATPIVNIKLPEGFTPIAKEPECVYSRLIGKMAKRKNLSFKAFAKAGVGFTRDSDLWEPYAIFPVMEYDRPVYYQGRTYRDVPGQPTKRFPSRATLPFGSRYWVYNIDAVRRRRPKTVVLLESILNVLSFEQKISAMGADDEIVAVALFKHAVSLEQRRKLFELRGVEELCFIFDADATALAWHEARYFNGRTVTVAEMPKSAGRTIDVNDDIELGWKVFSERRAFSVSSELEALVRA